MSSVFASGVGAAGVELTIAKGDAAELKSDQFLYIGEHGQVEEL